jgi:hypothetical protein
MDFASKRLVLRALLVHPYIATLLMKNVLYVQPDKNVRMPILKAGIVTLTLVPAMKHKRFARE